MQGYDHGKQFHGLVIMVFIPIPCIIGSLAIMGLIIDELHGLQILDFSFVTPPSN